MEKIKTFPIRFSESFGKDLEKAFRKTDLSSKHAFVIEAIREKITKELGGK